METVTPSVTTPGPSDILLAVGGEAAEDTFPKGSSLNPRGQTNWASKATHVCPTLSQPEDAAVQHQA